MIESINNHDETIRMIKMEKPYFNEFDFIEVLKLRFSALYRELKSDHTECLDSFCSIAFASKLKKEKTKILMLDDDIDFVSVQNGVVKSYRQSKEKIEIDVDLFLFYIDYMINNKNDSNPHKKRYFDCAYRITLVVPFSEKHTISETTCPMCGGHLTKNTLGRRFSCDYCQYERFIGYDDWKIDNIERI